MLLRPSVVFPLLAALLLSSPRAGGQDGGREAQAAEALERAEKFASKGDYTVASQRYKNLARRYPDTAAGMIAARRSQPNAFLGWADLVRHGPSSNRVDIVLMGDGYLLKKQESFDRNVEIVPKILSRDEVYGEYWSYHNVIRANVVSADDGVGGYGREYDTALKARASDLSAGQVSVNAGRVYDMLDELPAHDGLALVFVKAGSHGTGGGGIAALGGKPDVHKVIHEWGHAFADLGDEYSDDVGYVGNPREHPNVAATDIVEEVPWKHFLDAEVKGVGVYLGAAGRARGAWKPTVKGCVMADGTVHCVVCREAVVLRIHRYVDPIESALPDPHVFDLGAPTDLVDKPLLMDERMEFEVTVLRPASHDLEVSWYVLPQAEAPRPDRPLVRFRDRRRRGKLAELPGEPLAQTRPKRNGRHRFAWEPDEDLPPGLYRVICRAVDTTEMRGEKHPWVLRDDYGLLESERAWWVEKPDPAAPQRPAGGESSGG